MRRMRRLLRQPSTMTAAGKLTDPEAGPAPSNMRLRSLQLA